MIRNYLRPLWIFVAGNIFVLFLYLFFPTIADKAADLLGATPDMATWWGWTWVVGSIRLIIVAVAEIIILYGTARSFMDIRETM